MGKVYRIKDKEKFDEAFDDVAIPLGGEKPEISVDGSQIVIKPGKWSKVRLPRLFRINHGRRTSHYEVLEDHPHYFVMRNMDTGTKFQISKHTGGIVGIVK